MTKLFYLVSMAVVFITSYSLFLNPTVAVAQNTDWDCSDACLDAYGIAYDEIFSSCYNSNFDCEWAIINKDTADGTTYCKGYFAESCEEEIYNACEASYQQCLSTVDTEYNECLSSCMLNATSPTVNDLIPEIPIYYDETINIDFNIDDQTDDLSNEAFQKSLETSICMDGCDTGGSMYLSCIESCINAEYTCTGNNCLETPGIIQYPEIIDIDINDFTVPEILPDTKIEVDNIHEVTSDFLEVPSTKPPIQTPNAESSTKKIRAGFEQVRDFGQATGNIKDIQRYIDTDKFGDYNGVGIFVDAASSVIDFTDLVADGVSTADAAIKATADNFGVSAINTIPVFKVIDVFATTPDKILSGLGVSDKHWIRIVTQYLAKVSPSGVIKTTTELMVQDDWEDIGNALAHGWGKVKDAEGVFNTAFESGKLVMGTIGAGAVAIAQVTSDGLAGIMSIGEQSLGYLSGLFSSVPAN